MGFPIRTSPDQSLFAAPRSLSQRTTSFIASCRQGIHQTPLLRLIRPGRRPAKIRRSPRRSGTSFLPMDDRTGPETRADRPRSAFLTWKDRFLVRVPRRVRVRKASYASLHDVIETRIASRATQKVLTNKVSRNEACGGACRARTGDPLLAKQMLSQLS